MTSPFSPFCPGVGYIEARAVEYDGDGAEDATGNSTAAGTIGYRLVIKALLKLKLPVAVQAAILIGRHVYPPLLQKRCLSFFRALVPGGLHLYNLFLLSALFRYKFAIQIGVSYLKGRSMGAQYVLVPAVGVYEGTTRTMEDSPVINQWVSAYSAIHLSTSCN
jgi:hypothetical protein